MGVLVNPCHDQDLDCCTGIYARPEYKKHPMDSVTYGPDGEVFEAESSRWVDDERFYDETCVQMDEQLFKVYEQLQPDGTVQREYQPTDPSDGNSPCLENFIGRRPSPVRPPRATPAPNPCA